MTIEMIAVVKTIFESGEAFHHELHGRRSIGCEDNIEVIWIGVEKPQDFRSSISNNRAGRARVICIGVWVCQKRPLHLGRKALELRLAGQSGSTMVKVRQACDELSVFVCIELEGNFTLQHRVLRLPKTSDPTIVCQPSLFWSLIRPPVPPKLEVSHTGRIRAGIYVS
jgi:hypothetical protein